jgi:release factor glutamine methyltransferase
MSEVRERLNPGGRLLLFFGTSGDMAYLRRLIDRSGLRADTIGTRDLARDGINVTYCTFRLTS